MTAVSDQSSSIADKLNSSFTLPLHLVSHLLHPTCVMLSDSFLLSPAGHVTLALLATNPSIHLPTQTSQQLPQPRSAQCSRRPGQQPGYHSDQTACDTLRHDRHHRSQDQVHHGAASGLREVQDGDTWSCRTLELARFSTAVRSTHNIDETRNMPSDVITRSLTYSQAILASFTFIHCPHCIPDAI